MMKHSEFLFVVNKIDKLSLDNRKKGIKILLKDEKLIDPWCCISAKDENNIKILL